MGSWWRPSCLTMSGAASRNLQIFGVTANGIPERFVQDNYSHSKRNALRGLHYQKNPKAQGKLVEVFPGRIFDVAVDIRRGRRTFGEVGEAGF